MPHRAAKPLGLVLVPLFLLLPAMAFANVCNHCHNVHGHDVRVHHGGVARCSMCHTMHNSQDGQVVDTGNPAGTPDLLIRSTATDVCLTCHAGHVGNVFGTDPLNPPNEIGAGNFAFLLEDNLNDRANGGLNPISGDAAGHNIVSPALGVQPDATLLTAPGGTYPSNALSCTSCHDPHGNAGFRMLYGEDQDVQGGLYHFTRPTPEAEGLSIYHGRETDSKHNAYKSGMGEWCGNCHEAFLEDHPGMKHVTQAPLGVEVAAIYNAYDGTDSPMGGSPSVAYLAAVPFEDPAATLRTTAGPSASSTMMCLSCHRAHASSAPDAGRWDFGVTFLNEDGAVSGSYPLPNPYGSDSQRSLCNKCHVKDLGDAPAP